MLFVVSPEQKEWQSTGSSSEAGRLSGVEVDPLSLLVLKSFY